MAATDKQIILLHGDIKTPPLSEAARRETGYNLRQLQEGETLSMPHSRPMPSIGTGVHELRIQGANQTWRVIYRIDADAIVVAEVFSKKVQRTPKSIIMACQARFAAYDEARRQAKRAR